MGKWIFIFILNSEQEKFILWFYWLLEYRWSEVIDNDRLIYGHHQDEKEDYVLLLIVKEIIIFISILWKVQLISNLYRNDNG